MATTEKLDETIKTNYSQNGFVKCPELIDLSLCKRLLCQIRCQHDKFIMSHKHIDKNNYFAVINRWPLNQLIDLKIMNELIFQVETRLHNYFYEDFKLIEADVLYKSQIAPLATPCHQDISYAKHNPYSLSTWIALTDVTRDDSALQFLPGSHNEGIFPAVDFWKPDFIDEMRQSPQWQRNVLTCSVNAGSAITFSSVIWHASLIQKIPRERFAIVLRWGKTKCMDYKIPVPTEVPFGIWNCGEVTYNLLQNGLEKLGFAKLDSFEMIIEKWISIIDQDQLPPICHKLNAINALNQVKLLHQAYTSYGAGDGQGIVYLNLYQTFLLPLKIYLEER